MEEPKLWDSLSVHYRHNMQQATVWSSPQDILHFLKVSIMDLHKHQLIVGRTELW